MEYPLRPGKEICISWKRRGTCSNWERNQRCGFDHDPKDKCTVNPEITKIKTQTRESQYSRPTYEKKERKQPSLGEYPIKVLEEDAAASREARRLERQARHADEEEMEAFLEEIRAKKEAESNTKAEDAGVKKEVDDDEEDASDAPSSKKRGLREKCPLCKKSIVQASYEFHMSWHAGKGEVLLKGESEDVPDPTFEGQGRPRMIVLMGLPGSGKSTLCKLLLDDNWSIIDDAAGTLTVDDQGIPPRERMERAASQALKSGNDIVVDRTNIEPFQRAIWLKLLADSGISKALSAVVFINTPSETCKARILQREHHRLSNTEKSLQVVERWGSTS